MTVTIELPPEKEALLKAQAQAQGLTVAEWFLRLADNAASQHGKSCPEYENLSDLLLNSPFAGANLNLERSKDFPRPTRIE